MRPCKPHPSGGGTRIAARGRLRRPLPSPASGRIMGLSPARAAPLLDSAHPNLLALLSALFISVARTLYRGALASLSPLGDDGGGDHHHDNPRLRPLRPGRGLERWPLRGILWFALVGAIGGLGGRYAGMISIKLVGLARTPILTQTGLVWSRAWPSSCWASGSPRS